MTKLRDGRTVNLDAYDPAHEGHYNAYRCESGHHNLSLDVDQGTTPMFLICRRSVSRSGNHIRECGSRSTSNMYPPGQPPPHLFPVKIVWRAPTKGERKRAARDGSAGHYDAGGLELEWHV